ncbi:hypothetical protein NDU88_002367 [Pleurodeles waltl]|uniref:Uncharacterized protein n=1 Tax=Pleurodeles waltl TaxID=8319 RepID=A0AAV7U9G1_PLEWA|nr:hypothetical protein NDU88_002367 [Pleurodeles waltl]
MELPLSVNGVAEPGRPCERIGRQTLDHTVGEAEGHPTRYLCMRPPDGTGAALGNVERSGRGIALKLRLWTGDRLQEHGADGPAPRAQQTQSHSGAPQDLSVSDILAAHTQKFDDILRAVQSIKSTLEPKIDALCIDMGHLREEHKKLKERVTSMEESVDLLDVVLPDLEMEQVRAILGEGPTVMPQSAEDLL